LTFRQDHFSRMNSLLQVMQNLLERGLPAKLLATVVTGRARALMARYEPLSVGDNLLARAVFDVPPAPFLANEFAPTDRANLLERGLPAKLLATVVTGRTRAFAARYEACSVGDNLLARAVFDVPPGPFLANEFAPTDSAKPVGARLAREAVGHCLHRQSAGAYGEVRARLCRRQRVGEGGFRVSPRPFLANEFAPTGGRRC
jgi:hypothetical protein